MAMLLKRQHTFDRRGARNAARWRTGAIAALGVAAVCLPAAPAAAYLGPGAGLSALGSLLALVAGLAVAIVGFVWFPIKRLIRGMRKPSESAAADVRETAQE